MLINIEDIQVGDEILVPANASFKYLKVLSLPKKADSTTFRCSCYTEQRTFGFNAYQRTYKVHIVETDSSKHNDKISINMYGRPAWLVKREI